MTIIPVDLTKNSEVKKIQKLIYQLKIITMKKINLLPSLFILLVLLAGCKDDEPVDPRDAFVGTFQMNGTCNFIDGTNSQDNYNLTISKSSDQTGIILANLINSAQNINATVSGNSFTITQGAITLSNGSTININGTGNLNENTLSLNYSLQHQGQNLGNCTDNGNKQ